MKSYNEIYSDRVKEIISSKMFSIRICTAIRDPETRKQNVDQK